MNFKNFFAVLLGALLTLLILFFTNRLGLPFNNNEKQATPTFVITPESIQVLPDNTIGASSVKITASLSNDSVIATINGFPVNGQEAFTVPFPTQTDVVKITETYSNGVENVTNLSRADGPIVQMDIPMAKPSTLAFNLCNCTSTVSTPLTPQCAGVSYFDWPTAGISATAPDIRKITVTPLGVGSPTVYFMAKDIAGVVSVYSDNSVTGVNCIGTTALCMSLSNTLMSFGTATAAPYFSCRAQKTANIGAGTATDERVIFETVGCTVTVEKLSGCGPSGS